MDNTALTKEQGAAIASHKKQLSREAKQQRILDATVRCVRQKGFHATSMGDIAREAKISVGVIYLYFENKEAILEAIAEQDLADMSAKMNEFAEVPPEDLLDVAIAGLDDPITRHFERDRSALALEMVVEAARNPRVSAIMQKIDRQGRELSQHLMGRLSPEQRDVKRLNARTDMLFTLFEGMMIRGVLHPESDSKEYRDLFKKVFAYALSQTD